MFDCRTSDTPQHTPLIKQYKADEKRESRLEESEYTATYCPSSNKFTAETLETLFFMRTNRFGKMLKRRKRAWKHTELYYYLCLRLRWI
jgi:hypothetical protein